MRSNTEEMQQEFQDDSKRNPWMTKAQLSKPKEQLDQIEAREGRVPAGMSPREKKKKTGSNRSDTFDHVENYRVTGECRRDQHRVKEN